MTKPYAALAIAGLMTAGPSWGAPGPAPTSAPSPASGIAAAPMKAPGPNPTYPRLTAFPDVQVKAKVNALLTTHEREDRASRRDCRAQRSGGEAGTWETATAVTYLSRRFLSVEVTSSYDCGGAYPNDGMQAPVTFDLTIGAAVNWAKIFKPGFLPNTGAGDAHAPALSRLYRAGYPKDADKDCKDAISTEGGFGSSMILWLDAKRGLVVQPDFPHVMQACAEEVTLSPAALAPYVRDPTVLADLRATMPRK